MIYLPFMLDLTPQRRWAWNNFRCLCGYNQEINSILSPMFEIICTPIPEVVIRGGRVFFNVKDYQVR